jgi:hypothetical protein
MDPQRRQTQPIHLNQKRSTIHALLKSLCEIFETHNGGGPLKIRVFDSVCSKVPISPRALTGCSCRSIWVAVSGTDDNLREAEGESNPELLLRSADRITFHFQTKCGDT